jgi:hypothetical protein
MKRSESMFRKISKSGFIVFGLTIILLLSIFPLTKSNSTHSEIQISHAYSFDHPTIESINIEGVSYDRISLKDCLTSSNPGEPNLPSKGVYILLPPKSKLLGIQVNTGEKHVLGTGFHIEPVGEPIPITQPAITQKINQNPLIYNSNLFYPGELYEKIGIYSFRGYQILVLLLHPMQFNPITGELFYYENMAVTVNTIMNEKVNNLFRGSEDDKKEVMKKVDNPETAQQYIEEIKPVSTCLDNYDLLILTTDSFESGFWPLKEAHDITGVNTVIKTLSDVGGNDLDSIRNYIRTAYLNWGIDYVLIGGDANIVPAPILWVSGWDENVSYNEEYMPVDLYYACLDGPYNYDADDKWGEPTDGENGGDVDLIAEVYVGRACVDDMADVNNFVTKTVTYINKDPSEEYLNKTCLLGEYMGDYGIATYSGTYMDQLIDVCNDDGYTTSGIPQDKYDINKIYDSQTNYWEPSELISIINNGVHIINHLGHASYDYNMKMYSSDVDYLTNDDLCFIYSQGCMSGGFDDPDGYDCIAEQFTIKSSHGAFAGIWNARYGYFWSYSTDGDSQRLHRQFWDAVFGENISQIGKANHDSKEDNLAIIGRSCIRWCYYETNLFGDPSLSFFEIKIPNKPPEKPDKPSGPSKGKTGAYLPYSTSATDPEGNQIYYLWDWGDGHQSDWIGPYNSGETINANWTYPTEGAYDIKVKAKDIEDAESNWSEPLQLTIIKSKNKVIDKSFLQILEKLLENQPNKFQIIQILLNKLG